MAAQASGLPAPAVWDLAPMPSHSVRPSEPRGQTLGSGEDRLLRELLEGLADAEIGALLKRRDHSLVHHNDHSARTLGPQDGGCFCCNMGLPPCQHCSFDEAMRTHRAATSFVTVRGRALEITCVPLLRSGEAEAMGLELIRDVSDRYRTEMALRESEEKFRALTEHSADVIMRFDREHRHLYVNPAVTPQTGMLPQGFLGKTHEDLGFPPELCKLWSEAIDQVIETKQVNEIDFELQPGRWLNWLLMPELDQKGEVRAVITSARDISERKHAEHLLIESRNYLESIINNVLDPIYVKDETHRWVLVNDAFCHFVGRSREDVLGRTDFDVFPNLDEETHRSDRALLCSGKSVERELLLPRFDGTLREVLVTKCRHVDRSGKAFVVGVVRDVTERNRTLAALRKSEQQYRLIADNVGDVIWIMELPSLQFTYISPSVERASGFTPEEMRQVTLERILPADSLNYVKQGLEQALQLHVPGQTADHRLEIQEYKKDGSLYWVEITARILDDAQGMPREILEVTRDITARKRADELARFSAEFEHVIADIASDLIALELDEIDDGIAQALGRIGRFAGADRSYLFQLDRQGGTMSNTHEWCEDGIASGRSQNQKLALCEFPWFMDQLLGASTVLVPDVAALPDVASAERRLIQAQDILSLVCVPILRGNEVIGFVGFDAVREHRTWPPEVCALLNIVGKSLANALVAKSGQEQLLRAKMQSEEANRLKSRFLSNVSHEVRTPLNAIVGFSELILASESVERARERARVILKEADTLLALVNDLLDHAKMEEGRMEIASEELNLPELLARVCTHSRVRCQQKGLAFELNVPPECPVWVRSDGLRLQQILSNLLSNAVKFTETGTITLSVRILATEGDQNTLAFAVQDTGIGIPRERQDAIFEGFVQADSNTTRRFGGTGLGTTISRELVRLMGGEMGLKSEVGQGSVFWFTLPFQVVRSPQPIAALPSRRPGSSPAVALGGRILVAEDYPVNQEIAREHLERVGYSVHVVSTGREAVEACRKRPFDLVLMDAQMPEMDGFEATRQIRQGRLLPSSVPILGLTASAEVRTRQECLSSGMNDVVTKPVRRETLLAAVVHWMTRDMVDAKVATRVVMSSAQETEVAVDKDDEPVLDVPLLMEQFGGRKQLVEDVVKMFRASVAAERGAMRAALSGGDMEQLRRSAHKLKGGAGSVAAMRVFAAANRLEQAAANDREACPGLLQRLSEELDELEAVAELRVNSKGGESDASPGC